MDNNQYPIHFSYKSNWDNASTRRNVNHRWKNQLRIKRDALDAFVDF